MTTLTPLQKARLAKLLAHEISDEGPHPCYFWRDEGDDVTEREWPYVIERIKEGMVESGKIIQYEIQLDRIVRPISRSLQSATLSEVANAIWQTLGKEEA